MIEFNGLCDDGRWIERHRKNHFAQQIMLFSSCRRFCVHKLLRLVHYESAHAICVHRGYQLHQPICAAFRNMFHADTFSHISSNASPRTCLPIHYLFIAKCETAQQLTLVSRKLDFAFCKKSWFVCYSNLFS